MAKTFAIFIASILALSFSAVSFGAGTSQGDLRSCVSLFEAQPKALSLFTSLPPDLQTSFKTLKPSLALRFEKRFSKREKIRAEGESLRLITLLLRDTEATALRIRPLLKPENRSEALTELVAARNNHEAKRQELEDILLDIGYNRGTATSRRWREFRDKHERGLETIKRAAINSASAVMMGLPLYVRSYPQLRRRGDAADPRTQREIKIEVAMELARRLAAIAILAILTDELLEYAMPEWHVWKAQALGDLNIEDRMDLETRAIERWKDAISVFTGERPTDDSPETNEIRNLIRAASAEQLWLHVHKHLPLTAEVERPLTAAIERPAGREQAAQMAPAAPETPSMTEDERMYLKRIFGL